MLSTYRFQSAATVCSATSAFHQQDRGDRVTVVTCSNRVYEHCMLATAAAWVFAQHGCEPGEHVIVCREVF